jgi:hypothetical protein
MIRYIQDEIPEDKIANKAILVKSNNMGKLERYDIVNMVQTKLNIIEVVNS